MRATIEKVLNFDKSVTFEKSYRVAYDLTVNKIFPYSTICKDIKDVKTQRTLFILHILKILKIPKYVDRIIVLNILKNEKWMFKELKNILLYPIRCNIEFQREIESLIK